MVVSTPTQATPAALLASLLAALPTALPTTMTATGPSPTAGSDLYEAYLFGRFYAPPAWRALEAGWPTPMAQPQYSDFAAVQEDSPAEGLQPPASLTLCSHPSHGQRLNCTPASGW